MFRRYQVKLYPNQRALHALETWERHCRFIWNLCLEQRIDAWSKKKYPNYYDQCKQLTELKQSEGCSWLYETPNCMLQAIIGDLDVASKRMFKKAARRPRFKKRNLWSSTVGMYVPCDQRAIRNGFLKLPKIDRPIRMRGLKKQFGKGSAGNALPKLKSFNLKKIAGDWFASLLFEVEDRVNPSTSIVGIDRGITHILALSDETLVENPRWYRKAEKKLKKEQRKLSRKKKGSNRRKKQQLRLARVHRRVCNQRNDFLHKTSTQIAKNHGTCVVEDLKIKNMVKLSSGMAKSIMDAGWGMFCSMLGYKCRELIKVNPAYTSQTCSMCGHVGAKNRSGKNFSCTKCGHHDDADVNAAKNVLALGQSVKARGGIGASDRPVKREVADVNVTDKDVMIRLNGRDNPSFRCDNWLGRELCNCNVFRQIKGQPNRFMCNSCGATYTSSE